ncbi:MAG: hypothetical protein ACLP8S_03100 [Solirubrobacteraceae bacterium]
MLACERRLAAGVAAAGDRGLHPGERSFVDQVAVELRQGCEQVEDELAGSGGGVDRVVQ